MREIILNNDSKVIKSFNNNIVLVREFDKEKILFKKGIGFAKRPGDLIKKGTVIEKVFVIEDEDNQRNFDEIIDKVDNKLLVLFEEVMDDITDELNEELNENIHISLIDHIYYAIKRVKKKEEIQNPFLAEIETLYSEEFEMAQKISSKIKKKLNVKLPRGEEGFIALHIHSARTNGKLSNTIKYSYLSSVIVEEIEKKLNIKIDRKSLDYARFLTHVRFAIERVVGNKEMSNDLLDVIKERYQISYKIAEEISGIMCRILDVGSISEDEISYLAMHVERFRVTLLN